ncbi:dihydroorotase [Hyphomicrobium sp.]|jgi:dihydroorotase|uniref:dihydroorotase n=1 Tax=Hyphomicrobium sp. TaxID=82 RepID=UPI002BF228D6|nr:dihydroorotase [Hyphomicrobium sp.]HVZ04148.1 dihydroorotase [Hyphomicrobium sp.]
MPETFDVVIRDATVVNQDGEGVRDIAIANGRIAAIGDLRTARASEIIDAGGLHILPGVIDTQVHFREPGLDHKEDLETGSRAAVAGGVTAVFEMPNTKPLTTSEETLADKVRRARHRMFCDFAFFVGGTRDNISEIPKLEKLEASAGIKVFMGSSTGDLLVDEEAALDSIIANISRRASFHAEDEARLKARMHLRRKGDPSSHPEWRDPEAALIATKRLVGIAEKHGKRVHVLHISTAEEMAFLRDHKAYATVEVTPHHLTLEGPECYERLGTYVQMNPPVRDARHRAAIWAALRAGVVDVLGSDHAPHTREEKDHVYPDTHSGMTGVQTLVPIMLDHVNAGRLSLQRFVDLMSHGPQRLFGIRNKGRIAVGYDADLTIVDLKRQETISNDWIESRCGWTPYDGVKVTGWPVGTYVRGSKVMWEGEINGPARGEPVGFLEGFAR